ncbi:MAG: 23S rRNA methyltransferase [Chromatiales bacterium]|jgi:23S rRNA (uridine2552-2'-O)-methyltransferase|nr:23S rRNA methyltransferase [Chromatiales bacterium]
MAKGSSSKNWRRRQDSDEYVKRAQAEGWRSRAVYKLSEINERERMLRRGAFVLDLGAAPGAWSQYASKIVGPDGRVIAIDLLPMLQIPDVDIIQGDFREEPVLAKMLHCVGDDRVDLVMSDMAPNITGVKSVDQPRAMYLAELAADLAARVLGKRGILVIKLFHGEGFDDFVRDMRNQYATVKVRKPRASRPHSRETYLVARNIQL